MRYIRIPSDSTFTIMAADGPRELPLRFKSILIEILDSAKEFGTRAAARKAVFMEKAINEGEVFITLDDDQHALLMQAVNGFSWIPQAAKIMERAGWFAAIEEATSGKPEVKKEPQIVTNKETTEAK